MLLKLIRLAPDADVPKTRPWPRGHHSIRCKSWSSALPSWRPSCHVTRSPATTPVPWRHSAPWRCLDSIWARTDTTGCARNAARGRGEYDRCPWRCHRCCPRCACPARSPSGGCTVSASTDPPAPVAAPSEPNADLQRRRPRTRRTCIFALLQPVPVVCFVLALGKPRTARGACSSGSGRRRRRRGRRRGEGTRGRWWIERHLDPVGRPGKRRQHISLFLSRLLNCWTLSMQVLFNLSSICIFGPLWLLWLKKQRLTEFYFDQRKP